MSTRRWNWVLSADMRGRWITTQGYAETELDAANLKATLRFHGEQDGIYHWIDGTIDADDNVEAVVRSPTPGTPPFRLGGRLFRGDVEDGVHPMMLLLTDGTTVLSLAYGPCSSEGNYP